MLSVILFVLVISAFAVFTCFKFDRAFEEALSVSCMGIIIIMFLFGMLNILQVGAVVICAIAFFLYGFTVYYVIRNGGAGCIKKHLSNIITPGSIVFAGLVAVIAYCNKDRLAMTSDEFSHWLDTVVIMARIDRFGTAPNSTAIFPSYPPAMSLFQYLLEKINIWTTGDFSEWKCYFAYQLLCVAVMLPFIRVTEEGFVKKLAGAISWLAALMVPLCFFKDMLGSLYIDPFLGVMGGCGFAAVALTKNKDMFYKIYMIMLCATLALAKDVGIYLAMFIGLFYLIDYVAAFKGESKWKRIYGLLPLAAMMVAKMLWKLELSISHTPQKFGAPFDIKGTIATIQGHGNEFYTAVYDSFRAAITYNYIYYERMGFNYTSIMVLLTVAFILFSRRLYHKGRISKASCVAGSIIPSITVIFYILSLFPLYISRFVEEEARNLASFDRYCGIVCLTGLLFAFWLLRDAINDVSPKVVGLVLSVLLTLSVFHSKVDIVKAYTSRETVATSQGYRNYVNMLADKINRNTPEDAKILMVGFDEDAVLHPILSTITKPRSITYSDIYFPAYVDESGSGMSTEDLEDLLKSDYDYVAIYSVTDNLTQTYIDVFDYAGDISDRTLYAVDKSTGKLSFVE